MATFVDNKKILYNYEILDEYEAGIKLLGFEVKAVRKKSVSLKGAYVIIRGGETYLVGAQISPYQVGNTPDGYDPERPRQLLLKKAEITKLIGKEKEKGLTLIPVSMYNKGPFIKVRVALVRGKKKHDKRETLKKRDAQRHIERTLKNQYR